MTCVCTFWKHQPIPRVTVMKPSGHSDSEATRPILPDLGPQGPHRAARSEWICWIWSKTGRYPLLALMVGGWPTPLKNMKVKWDDEIPNMWKHEKHNFPNHQPDGHIWPHLIFGMLLPIRTTASIKASENLRPPFLWSASGCSWVWIPGLTIKTWSHQTKY